jgi:hypothetical protein
METSAMIDEQVKPITIRLALPPARHREFRIEAARNTVNMATLARQVIEAYLDSQQELTSGQKKGKKP